MGTKNQAMAAKRQQRAKKRKGGKKTEVRRVSNSKLQFELASKGIMATVGKYKDLLVDKKQGKKLPDNLEVTKQILGIVEMFAPIHSAVEVAEILKNEGKIEFTPAIQELVDNFDRLIVQIAEDMTAIRILMDEGQTMDDFVEIYVHLFDNVTECMHFHARPVFEELLKPNQAMIEEYTKEHKEPGTTDMNYAFELHDQRIARIQHLYRTIAQVEVPESPADEEDDLPAEFIEAGDISMAELTPMGDEPRVIKDIN